MRDISELFETDEGNPGPVGLRVDDLVYWCGVTGTDPSDEGARPDLLRQVGTALATIDTQLQDLGGSLDNVAYVSFLLRDPADIRRINTVWTKRFPDELSRPAYKFMRARLAGSEEVRLNVFAVLGAARESLYLPKVAHANPIPLAVKAGRYLFSSRVLPYDPATGEPGRDGAEQAAFAVLNVSTLLEQAGMSWRDVTQARAFVADPALDALVRAEWRRQCGDTDAAPLRITRYRAGALTVLLEIIAVH
ncbi:MAG TPA: Rid family hydrolase [Actinospica sp.]|nr:Rid family hydrolase [Actinospica sp.]